MVRFRDGEDCRACRKRDEAFSDVGGVRGQNSSRGEDVLEKLTVNDALHEVLRQGESAAWPLS